MTKREVSGPFGTCHHYVGTRRAGMTKRAGNGSSWTSFLNALWSQNLSQQGEKTNTQQRKTDVLMGGGKAEKDINRQIDNEKGQAADKFITCSHCLFFFS